MPGFTPLPNYYGRQLIGKLKQLREQSGMTQEQAGARVRIELKKLSRLEIRQLPTYHELIALLDVYGVPNSDWDPYVELLEQAKAKPWWREFGLHDEIGYLSAEDQAHTMMEFQLGHLPELLQTESYALELYKQMPVSREENLDTKLAVLVRRQERLFDGKRRLNAHFIVHEPVLRQVHDRAQLLQLAEWARRPNITLQILPQSVGLHPGLAGSMVLFGFREHDGPDEGFLPDISCGFRKVNERGCVHLDQALKDLERTAMRPQKTLHALAKLAQED